MKKKKKERRETERCGNWIEHLSGTEGKRVDSSPRKCEEKSRRYKRKMNGGGRESKTLSPDLPKPLFRRKRKASL